MSIIQDYITRGWLITAIPPAVKGPSSPGWNTRAGALASESVLSPDWGVGLMHAYSGTMALDIDDWARTLARGIDVDALAAAPDSVMIHSGKPGHGKLLYKMPMGLRLPTKKFQDEIGRDANNRIIRLNVFELRCGTIDDLTVQDVLPPSIHPETLQPYTWGGNGHWMRLPMIPVELLDFWNESLKDIRPATANGVDSSWGEIRSALASINPDCSREDWIHAGMAIKWAGEQTYNPDQAFAVWNGWSSQGHKYPGDRAITAQWRSFRSEKNQVVTLGTLFHLATQNGWVRPALDASSLFGDVSTMVPPADVIQTMKAAPPDIDLSLWPAVLSKRAHEVSESVGCDPVVPLWAGLAAACAVVDAQSRLELMPGFKVPPVLWLMTIGDPGDRKSPGSRPMMAPLKDIEMGDKQRFAQDMTVWTYKQAQYAAASNAMQKYAGSPEGLLDASQAPTVPPIPIQPVPLRFTVSDITSQDLLGKCQFRPRGMLAYFDELNSWAAKMTNKMSGENRSTWVVGFESEYYELDRVKNGATFIENFALSIYGNMQPTVLEDSFTDLAKDGLLQRFLPAVCRHNKTKLNKPLPDFMTSAGAWENTLRLTYAMPKTMYRLTPEAFQAFRRFQEWYEDRMHQERLMRSSNEFVTAFGKITGLVGRLALMFHILENPWVNTVSVELMERVIRIAREYIIPTYRYVFDGDGSSSAFDSWVMEYIIQHADKNSITMSDIKVSARRPFEKANTKTPWQAHEWIINAMYLLEKMNWVARSDDGSKEGKGQAAWFINPHLKTTFKAYRDAVVQAKLDRNADRLERSGSKHLNHVHGADSLTPVDVQM